LGYIGDTRGICQTVVAESLSASCVGFATAGVLRLLLPRALWLDGSMKLAERTWVLICALRVEFEGITP